MIMKKMFLFAFVVTMAMGASAQMNVWENGGLSAQYAIESVDSVTFGITSETPSSGTGKDGITPLLKIENDYWYVSYDEGQTWQQEGKAKGEKGDKGDTGEKGEKGEKGDKGDAMFLAFEQDGEYVYLTLPDSSKVKIAKVQDTPSAPNEDDVIEFKDSYTKALLLSKGIDANGDGEISYEEAASVTELNIESDKNLQSFKEFQHFTGIKTFSFYNNSSLFEIVLPKTIKTIPEQAFSHTSIYNMTIPEGCVTIEKDAFSYCTSLVNIKIPNSVRSIQQSVFFGTALKEFIFPENYGGEYGVFGVYGTNEKLAKIYWNTIYYIANYAVKIGSTSYYGLGAVESSKTNSSIKELVFGEKVKSIPAYLCYGLIGLTEITLPATIEVIGKYAFAKCTMETIYCKATTPPIIGESVFPTTATIYVPTEVVEDYRDAWSDYENKIVGYDFE